MKKKVNMFGKGIPVFAIVILGMALVAAALITSWGTITGSVTVGQGLFLDDKPYNSIITEAWSPFTSLESKVFVSAHELDNQADVDAEVNLHYTCVSNNCNDITTGYYLTNLRQGTLELSRKDSSWHPVGTKITVTYSTDANGKFIASVTGGTVPSDYVLVYYVDKEFMTGTERLATPGDAYLINDNFAIPYAEDGNLIGSVNYCSNTIDIYAHCKGAKLWLVPSAELVENKLSWLADWQTRYYFETDLLGWNPNNALTNTITVPAKNNVDFVIVNNFPKMLVPDTYAITTEVKPVI